MIENKNDKNKQIQDKTIFHANNVILCLSNTLPTNLWWLIYYYLRRGIYLHIIMYCILAWECQVVLLSHSVLPVIVWKIKYCSVNRLLLMTIFKYIEFISGEKKRSKKSNNNHEHLISIALIWKWFRVSFYITL